MMRVAVSQRIDFAPDRQESRDVLDQRIVAWLARAGVLAFPVPNHWPVDLTLGDWLMELEPQGVVLTGGQDIGQTPARDLTECGLLSWAEARHLPVLGLCRGMQVMALFAGGKTDRVPDHAGKRHALTALAPNMPSEVNSFHHWALLDAPSGYEILARANDETVEAIRHVTLPWEGWMWHPERELEPTPNEHTRLRALLNQANSGARKTK